MERIKQEAKVGDRYILNDFIYEVVEPPAKIRLLAPKQLVNNNYRDIIVGCWPKHRMTQQGYKYVPKINLLANRIKELRDFK